MASTTTQQALCPVCHQTDMVKNAPAAYESGVTRLAPPTMPVAHVRMIGFISAGFLLVLFGSFFILVWSGTNGYAGWPGPVQVLQAALTITAIVTALVLSYIALHRVVRGDMKSQKFLPVYDETLEKWRNLAYCKRDDVVFDPLTNKTLNDAALRGMLTIDMSVEPPEPQSIAMSH